MDPNSNYVAYTLLSVSVNGPLVDMDVTLIVYPEGYKIMMSSAKRI